MNPRIVIGSNWRNDKTIPVNCIKCHKRLSTMAQTMKRHMKRCSNIPYNKIQCSSVCVKARVANSK